MERARRSLTSAGNLLHDGDHDFAMSRAYFAMFYAATAALLSINVKRSKHPESLLPLASSWSKEGNLTQSTNELYRTLLRIGARATIRAYFPAVRKWNAASWKLTISSSRSRIFSMIKEYEYDHVSCSSF
jgi:uncharacterized protein (UPF0332 family)